MRRFKGQWVTAGRARIALAVALAGAVAVVAAGCGGGSSSSSSATTAASTGAAAPTSTPAETGAAAGETGAAAPSGGGGEIKIGMLSTCQGPFAPFYDATLAGGNTAIMRLFGGQPAGAKPSDGVTGAQIDGKAIKLYYGCSNAVSADKALSEARRLIEQVGVDILIGPLSGDEGIAVANYSKKQPNKTFLNGDSGAQDTTLKVRSPNFFRFNTDGAQWMAGVGDYAYSKLGWRNAVTVADDYSFAYTQVAGFVAEFCAVGGKIEKRIWPPLGTTDYSTYVTQIPRSGIDGFYLATGGTGALAFVKAYTGLGGSIAKNTVAGSITLADPLLLKSLGDRTIGATTGGPVPADSTQPYFLSYLKAIRGYYPNVQAEGSLWDVNMYLNELAAGLALKDVNADLSDGQKAFQAALAKTVLKPPLSPIGTVKLDENRQAIANNYVFQVAKMNEGDAGYVGSGLGLKTLYTVPNVSQSFGGFFTTSTPPPSRTFPPCVKKTPPPWVGHEIPGAQ